MNTSKIFCIGHLTIDDIVILENRQISPNVIGGNTLFTAVGIKLWGGSSIIHARIGKDFPNTAIENLHNLGIKTNLIKVDANDLHVWALYERGGDRQFVKQLSSGSFSQMTINSDELSEELLSAASIHVAPMPVSTQYKIIKKLYHKKNKRTIISLDLETIFIGKHNLNNYVYKMLPYVDVFMPSKEHVVMLENSGIDLMAAAKKYSSFGPSVVAIKMNIDGSLVYSKLENKFYHIPIYQCNAYDTTGAGDSYCGGFLNKFIDSRDILLSGCYGTVSASYTVETIGALNVLKMNHDDKEERLSFVKQRVKILN